MKVFGLETKRSNKLPQIIIYLQKFWRGTLARKYFKRLKAANKIAMEYKAYKLRNYVKLLHQAYGCL
jgi:myosin-1